MISLTVLCEGQTESLFVSTLLAPTLRGFEVHAKPVNLGGGLSWPRLKAAIRRSLAPAREHVWATTMVDLYGLPKGFPGGDATSETGARRAERIEAAMADEVAAPRFIPYVQVHEFEALLYADILAAARALPLSHPDLGEALINDASDLLPEEINEGASTSPSARIARCHPRFRADKAASAVIAMQAVGLEKARARCPHFGRWLAAVEALGKEG